MHSFFRRARVAALALAATVGLSSAATAQTDGQLLIGNSTGNVMKLGTISGTANRVTVTNGSGTITLSLPQDIDNNASPVFNGLTLGGFTVGGIVHNDVNGVLSSSLIVNADIAAAAGISLSKLAALGNNFALVSNGSGVITTSSVSAAELGYVQGVTSAIQTQLDAKLVGNAAITGATKTKITYDAKGLVTAGADATTTDIAEGTNMYYTDTRARLAISSSATGLTYNSGTGDLSLSAGSVIPTTTEQTNWNDANSKKVSSWTAPLQYSAGTASITQATGSANGYLSSADWTTFNNKVATGRTINTTAPLSGGGDLSADRTLSISQATTSTDGYLSSTDWNTFNGKQSTSLANGTVWIGNGSGVATAVTLSGDVTTTNAGVTSIGAAKVTNTMLAGSIAASKLVGTDIATVGTITAGTWNGTTIAVANGGTGAVTLTGYVKGTGTAALSASSTIPGADISGNISGNAANVTGTVAVANGGTGAITANGALNALLPAQATHAGKVLQTNGTDASWVSTGTAVTMGGDLSGSADNAQIVAGAVGTTEIADASVTSAKIATGAVTSAKIGNGEVATINIAADAVTSAKIGAGEVGTTDIANGAITSAKIGTGEVATTNIAADAITSAKIGAGEVATSDIADAAVTDAKIAAVASSKLTGQVSGANGGTGVDNTGKTITLGGNLTTSGAFATTLTVTGTTNVTLPTSGTLATTGGTWTTTGNSGTTSGTNFVGTTDAQELVFKTNNVEGFRMTVDATAPRLSFTGAAPTFRLELPNSATNAIGRARANSWAVYSSEVWKENIRTIDNPLAKALALRGVYYNYKPQYGGVKDIGFIAEEVDKVIPEVVYKDDKGAVAAMDYQRLTALLVEALKEEHAKTEAMAKDIAELKAMVATLAAAVKPATSTDTPVIGAGSTTVIDIKPATIGQNVPNPFEGVTSIPYFIPKGVNVAELVISDNGSNELRRVVLGDRGVQSKITLSMSEFTSGVYQYALIVDGKIVDTKSMTLVR